MESQEYEMWIHSDDGTLENFARNCVEYQERLDEASTKFGKQMNSVRLLEGKMRDAGFVDVRSDIYKVSSNMSYPGQGRDANMYFYFRCRLVRGRRPRS